MTREKAEWELFGTDWHDTYGAKKNEESLLKADDMLPVPKAGAAAPPNGKKPPAPDPDDADPDNTDSPDDKEPKQ